MQTHKTAIVTLSDRGLIVARHLAQNMDVDSIYVHSIVKNADDCVQFDRVVALTPSLFEKYKNIIYIMPTGVVTRAIAPCVVHKLTDPAVVVTDVAGRWAISLLSGHEGGANEIALEVSNILDGEPIITTTTETDKTLIAGIGCRKGASADQIIGALKSALETAECKLDDLRYIATADVKKDEPGLIKAAEILGIPLRIIGGDSIRNTAQQFEESLAKQKVNLPAVAEPSALLAGRRTSLLLKKQKYTNVTIALARESSLWSE